MIAPVDRQQGKIQDSRNGGPPGPSYTKPFMKHPPIQIREGRPEDAAIIAEYNQRMALETERQENWTPKP